MYNHREIEKKWQKKWADEKLYQAVDDSKKEKYYVLDMFPYPSGAGLHVGHPKGYIATDVIARQKMMAGFNVLHPMGWDAFGLPAENYAIANHVHPRAAMAKNIALYKRQLESLGLTFDWSREIDTTDPQYYKWTQWAFAQMFKKGLVYESHEPINWCPSCLTGLANEDVEDGKCERCGTMVEKKPLRQWVIRITDYAERLLDGLDKLTGWEDMAVVGQRNWIGRSDGVAIKFKVQNPKLKKESVIPAQAGIHSDNIIEVFTTRPDTIFGATYLVLCPEHELIKNFKLKIKNFDEIQDYLEKVKNKSDLERTDLNKNKTGVRLDGLMAINPANNEEIPIFVADYVLAGYGTGAIMAVPAFDERDLEFAKKYDLEVRQIEPDEKIIKWLEKEKIGERKTQYKLKDWVFSRQRYWGEPIPLVFCENCKKNASDKKRMDSRLRGNNTSNKGEELNPGWFVEEDLPLELPDVKSYEPTGTGESPLANIDDWVNVKCPRCGGKAKRETNTMPQWAGSSWYFLAYTMPRNQKLKIKNQKYEWDRKAIDYWNPVDCYVGGAEHIARHMIYARFWHKFLYDIGAVGTDEPFSKFRHVGLILAADGRKMSKRWNNVVNPDDLVDGYGADALRVYEMFMGPFEQAIAWNNQGVGGARKFLEKIAKLKAQGPMTNDQERPNVQGPKNKDTALKNLLHKTIKKVGSDIAEFKFNTAVSALMILVNEMGASENIETGDYEILLQLVAPFAPHLAEELWSELGNKTSIFLSTWPVYDEKLIVDETVNIAVQVNGKLRATITMPADINEKQTQEIALADENVKKWLDNKKITKVVIVKNRLISIVTA